MDGLAEKQVAGSLDQSAEWGGYLSALSKLGPWRVSHTIIKGWAWVQCESSKVHLIHLGTLLQEASLREQVSRLPGVVVVDTAYTPTTVVRDCLAIEVVTSLLRSAATPLPLTALWDNLGPLVPGLGLEHLRRLLEAHPHRIQLAKDGSYYNADQETAAPPDESVREDESADQHTSTDGNEKQIQSEIVEVPTTTTTLPGDPTETTTTLNEGSPARPDLAKAVAALLIEVAKADARVLPVEVEYIESFLRKELALSETAIQWLQTFLRKPDSLTPTDIEPLRWLPLPVRKELLRAATLVAYADDQYIPEERSAIFELGKRLRLDGAHIDNINKELQPGITDATKLCFALELPLGCSRSKAGAQLQRVWEALSPAHQPTRASLFSHLLEHRRTYLRELFARAVWTFDASSPREGKEERKVSSGNLSARTATRSGDPDEAPTNIRELFRKTDLEAFLGCKKTRALLSKAGLTNVEKILDKPPRAINKLQGLDVWSPAWAKLCTGLGKWAHHMPSVRPIVEAYLRKSQTLSDIEAGESARGIEMPLTLSAASAQTLTEASVVKVLLDTLKQAKGIAPLWKIRDQLDSAGFDCDPDFLQKFLRVAVDAGELFELSNARYALPKSLTLPALQTESLRRAALAHLENADELSAFDGNWRPDHRILSADDVDYALSGCPSLDRTSPGIYRSRDGTTSESITVSALASEVASTIVSAVSEGGTPRTLESFSLKSTGVPLAEVSATLKNDERVRLDRFTNLWISLVDWGDRARAQVLAQVWRTSQNELRKLLDNTESEQFSEADWRTIESLLVEDQDIEHILRFRAKLSPAAFKVVSDRANDLLEGGQSATRLSQLITQLSTNRQRRDDLAEILSGDQRFVRYPFGSKDWVGLATYPESIRVGVVRDSWLYVKIALEDHHSGREQLEYTDAEWTAVVAVAREKGLLELIPPEHRGRASAAPVEIPALAESLTDETPAIDLFHTPTRLLKTFLDRAEGLPRPYSLAELRVTGEELAEVRAWFANIGLVELDAWFGNRQPLDGVQNRWQRDEGFGFLALVLLSEVTRREGCEGALWAVVAPNFSARARRELFVGHHPRAELSRCLERAARKAELRQAYARAGNQGTYVTVYLQLGFTHQGLARLPKWLSEGAATSQSIEILCAETKSSFARLWQSLKSYRRGQVPRSEMRGVLENSPWVLKEWVDAILDQAKAVYTAVSAFGSVDNHSRSDLPKLSWNPPEPPRLSYSLDHLTGDLSQTGYDVLVNEELVGRATRESDGAYVWEPAIVELAPEMGFSSIVLVGDDDDEQSQRTIAHYPDEAGRTFFELSTGYPAPQNRLRGTQGLAILVNADETVSASVANFELTGLNKILFYLERLEDLDEEQVQPQKSVQGYDFGSSRVKIGCLEKVIYIGRPFELAVSGLPTGASLIWARMAGHDLDVQSEENEHIIAGTLHAAIARSSMSLEIAVRHQGRQHRLERAVQLPVFGVTMLEDGEWTHASILPEISVRETKERPFRFMVGADDLEDYALVEGDVIASTLSRLPNTLSNIEGFGAPLTLRRGPYNSTSNGYVIAEQVINSGLIQSFQRSQDQLYLHLGRRVSPGPEHSAWLWEPGHGLHEVPRQGIEELSHGLWALTLPAGFRGENFVVGISYQGERRGAAWVSDLEVTESTSDPHLDAALLRWFQLPLLATWLQPSVTRFVETHSEATFEEWVQAREVQGLGLVHAAGERAGWNSVVRSYFRKLPPGVILKPWKALCRKSDTVGAFEVMTDVDPVLAARMVIAENSQMKAHSARNNILGLGNFASDSEALGRLQALLETARKEMLCDIKFVERTCQAVCGVIVHRVPIDATIRRNLAIACNVDPFRRYLAGSILHTWLEEKECRD